MENEDQKLGINPGKPFHTWREEKVVNEHEDLLNNVAKEMLSDHHKSLKMRNFAKGILRALGIKKLD